MHNSRGQFGRNLWLYLPLSLGIHFSLFLFSPPSLEPKVEEPPPLSIEVSFLKPVIPSPPPARAEERAISPPLSKPYLAELRSREDSFLDEPSPEDPDLLRTPSEEAFPLEESKYPLEKPKNNEAKYPLEEPKHESVEYRPDQPGNPLGPREEEETSKVSSPPMIALESPPVRQIHPSVEETRRLPEPRARGETASIPPPMVEELARSANSELSLLPDDHVVFLQNRLSLQEASSGPGFPEGSVGGATPAPRPEQLKKASEIAKALPASAGQVSLIAPRYAYNPKPLYPKVARLKGIEGEVIVRVEVLASGRVGRIELRRSSGYEVLDSSALEAVKKWKFLPAKQGENPVAVWVNIPISFRLQ